MIPRFEKRVKAFAIDISALMIAVIIAALGLQNVTLKVVIVVVVYILVNIVPNFFSRGQTFGKRIQKIKIVNDDGSDISVWKAILRELVKTALSLVTFGLYSVIAYFFLSEKTVSKTIHDYIFKTKAIDLETQKNRNNDDYLGKTESMKKRGF
ncbi:RDD family protein [Haploplasma axanthum]|nr:RDD family protein [Haploplasma axanthum]